MEHWTNTEIEYINNNYNKETSETLSKNINRTPKAIRKYCAKHGLILSIEDRKRIMNRRNVSISEEDLNFVKSNINTLSSLEMAEHLNFSVAKLKNIRQHYNLKIPKNIVRRKIPSKFIINSTMFINPIEDDQQKIGYLIGFFWADGSIQEDESRIRLGIAYDDAVDIIPLFQSTGDWSISTRKPKKAYCKDITTIASWNKELHTFMKKHDFLVKSMVSPTKLLHGKSETYTRGFWRGFFDGDGCYHINNATRKRSISASGPYDYDWSSVTDLLNNLEIKYITTKHTSKSKNHKYSQTSVRDFESLLKLCNYIFPNTEYDGVGLKRKFEKMTQIRSHINAYYTSRISK
jgi:hypothetical protein